jgi:CubicO group peptidase (beta-lactamase class C family)
MRYLFRFSRLVALSLSFGSVSNMGSAAEPRVTDGLRSYVDKNILAGAVTVVSSPERTLAIDAVGYSDLIARTPMRTDALFWIASMNKPITATAFMMLVDEGKARLDDPVEKYLPEYRNQMFVEKREKDRLILKKPKHPITVREVLSHTSGVVVRSPLERELDMLPIREGVITYALSPLNFEPGTKYEYSNGGINTVGRLIEVLSGRKYEDFLQERLLTPLGMKDTTFWPSEEQIKRLAKSYHPNSRKDGLEETTITQLSYPLTDRKRHPYPAGGLFSTAEDIAIFGRMILNGGAYQGTRYVSESAVKAMTSTQTGSLLSKGKDENGYGLGFSTSRKSGGDHGPVIPGRCGHGGAYSTNLSIDPERKLVLVYMVQHAGYPGVDSGKVLDTFTRAAESIYGKTAGR